MQSRLSHTAPLSVYPGEYIPLFEECDLEQEMEYLPGGEKYLLLVNVKESACCYEIEIPVPGAGRENFLIKVDGNILSISMILDDRKLTGGENIRLHEYDFGCCCNRKIVLADNADAAFMIAEYRSGVLHLYVPKSAHPLKQVNTKIAVY